MRFDLDCKEVASLISDGQDQQMDSRQQARLRLHFVLCETCRNVDEQMAYLRRAMRDMDKADPDRK